MQLDAKRHSKHLTVVLTVLYRPTDLKNHKGKSFWSIFNNNPTLMLHSKKENASRKQIPFTAYDLPVKQQGGLKAAMDWLEEENSC